MTTITVSLGERSYPIWIAQDRYRALGRCVRALKRHGLGVVVTNRVTRRLVGRHVVRALTAEGWRLHVMEVPDSERAKSPAVALQLVQRVAHLARQHTPVLFALGGGVVGDVTGFAASTFRRGVPYVQLPTTLLAQVDSAIGGKVGVDLPEGKNLLGAFYQPRAVYSDITSLPTLPPRQLRSGLSEVIKYAAIADRMLWQRLERRSTAIQRGQARGLAWIVARCARIKARVVSRDERDTRGERMLLNFGHTAGHALEAATGYTRLTHGEAIAVGMAVAADVGVVLGITPAATRQRLIALLEAYGLPTTMRGVSPARVMQAMSFDKKFVSGVRQRWVLLRGIGHASVIRGVAPAIVEHALRQRVSAHG